MTEQFRVPSKHNKILLKVSTKYCHTNRHFATQHCRLSSKFLGLYAHYHGSWTLVGLLHVNDRNADDARKDY